MNKVVVAFGDSITEGVAGNTPKERIWTSILQKKLGDGFTVINAGVGGNSAREAMMRYEKDVLSHHPDIVIIEFGGNNHDTSRPERRVDDNEFKEHLETFRKGLPAGCKVIVVTFPPIIDEKHAYGTHPFFGDAGLDKSMNAQRNIVRDFALRNGYALLDLYSIMSPRREQLILDDGVHLNCEGQALFAEEAFKTITQLSHKR